ncbi:hypothetical protein SLEP1_g34400 [Rubroshorea leprosula]|uniref:Photosystem II protein K n=1 Tax=Rubroshorea leprosula TaxID=152421 RepID=A0AAV5KJW6_9ROSI|nr:hypothetical protein SLEP1_g34400 [Rubroshorea leprosula]
MQADFFTPNIICLFFLPFGLRFAFKSRKPAVCN